MEIAYRKSMLDQQTSSPLKPTTITMERVLKKNSLNWRQSKGDHWHFDSNNPTPPSPLTHQPQSSGSHHHGTQRGSQSRRCVIMCPHGREPAHFSSMLGFFSPQTGVPPPERPGQECRWGVLQQGEKVACARLLMWLHTRFITATAAPSSSL